MAVQQTSLVYHPTKFLFIVTWICVFSAVIGISLFSQFMPLDGQQGQGLARFLGRFHPLILHFPIACLVLAGLCEFVGLFSFASRLQRATHSLLFFAAVSALITVTLGLMLAANEGHQGVLVESHRLLGLLVAVLSCFTWGVFISVRYFSGLNNHLISTRLNWLYRITLLGNISVMGLAAHDGGSLVHGPNYLAEYSPAILAPIFNNQAVERLGNNDTKNAQHKSFISEHALEQYQSDVGQFMSGYCYRCHGEGKQESNLRLDTFDPSFQHFSSQDDWQRVFDVLGAHHMPPKDAKQPSARQRANAMQWIQGALEEYAYARRADMANAPLRRLNKRELNHTYQDLFKVDANFVSRLPTDPKSEKGYDNSAELLQVSMSDIKAYHGIARQAVQRYVTFEHKTQKPDEYFVEMEEVYHFGRGEGDDLSHQRAAVPLSKQKISALKEQRKDKGIVYRDRVYGPLPHRNIPQGNSREAGEGRGFARLHEQFMLLSTENAVGEVVVKVSAAMTPGKMTPSKKWDKSLPRLRLEAGWRHEQSLRVKIIGEHDITAAKDSPQVVEFRFRLEDVIAPEMARRKEDGKQKWLLLVLSNVARDPRGVLAGSIYGQVDTNLTSSQKEGTALSEQADSALRQQNRGLALWRKAKVPLLYLDALEAKITPANADRTTPWIVRKPKQDASLEDEKALLQDTLLVFLPKVYRKHRISDHELQPYLSLFESLRTNGDSYKTAVQETLAAALISPQFLYIGFRQESQYTDSDIDDKHYANHYLASRLSYYLWSSMPDEALKLSAENGELLDPAVLAKQIERMLADKRALRFTETFSQLWLQLDKLKDIKVSEDYYPDYGAELGRLSVKQTVATFQDNFHNQRDARELYFSEYMMLNAQLAHLYQLPKMIGGELVRTHIGADHQQLGLLTQASVLTMNSDGQDSHPIKRGVWMLERLFNDPPPPPPPAVPDLDTNNPELAGLTLKQKIEQHRQLSGCSGCHEKIDPWGILLENYDAIGQWRDAVTVYKPLDKEENRKVKPSERMKFTDPANILNVTNVDASSVLLDSTAIKTMGELASYLKDNKQPQLMKAIVEHMMMYALGRELDILDEQEAEVILSTFRASGYKLSELTKAIVQSDAFTNRQLKPSNTIH